MNIIILAAGINSRLLSDTENVPKAVIFRINLSAHYTESTLPKEIWRFPPINDSCVTKSHKTQKRLLIT